MATQIPLLTFHKPKCIHRELRKVLPALAEWEIDAAFRELTTGNLQKLPIAYAGLVDSVYCSGQRDFRFHPSKL